MLLWVEEVLKGNICSIRRNDGWWCEVLILRNPGMISHA